MSGREPTQSAADGGSSAASADARVYERVRDLVALTGPADPLPPVRATAVAAFVLFQTIVRTHNRLALGTVPDDPDVREVLTFGPALREAIGVIAGRVLAS